MKFPPTISSPVMSLDYEPVASAFIYNIKINDILRVKDKRKDASYEAIKKSLKEKGQIAPIIVSGSHQKPGLFKIEDGHVRVCAFQDLDYAFIHALTRLSPGQCCTHA